MSGHTVENGRLSVDLFALFEDMTDADKEAALRVLLCERVVVESIVGQIVDQDDGEGSHTYANVLDQCRMALVEFLGDTEVRLFRNLAFELDSEKGENERLRKWAWSLWHAWPEGALLARPEQPDFVRTAFVDEDAARAAIAKARGDA